MKMRSDFSQFRATEVTYRDAFRLAGCSIAVMKMMRATNGETLLPTGAKLTCDNDRFYIFSYASDGRDGWKAYIGLHPKLKFEVGPRVS